MAAELVETSNYKIKRRSRGAAFLLLFTISTWRSIKTLNRRKINIYICLLESNKPTKMKKHYSILCMALCLLAQQAVTAQKLQTSLTEIWNGTGWDNWQKATYNYDSNNNLLTLLQQTWTNSAWQNSSLGTQSNDASGNATLSVNQTWAVAANTWTNSTRTTITYTASKPLVMTYELWTGSGWQNWAKYFFTYDNSLNLVSQTYQSWTSGAWVNGNLYTFTNNAGGNPTQTLAQSWVSAASTWSNSTRTATTYTANKPLTMIDELWDGSAWKNWNRSDFAYDNNLNQLSQTYQNWNNNAWINTTIYSYTNNASGNPTLTIAQNWISAASTWSNSTRITSTYLNIPVATGIEQHATEGDIKAYPLPAADLLYIDLNENTGSYVISDINGKQVLCATLTRENNAINVSSLSQGIYFLKPENGKTIKIIKQ